MQEVNLIHFSLDKKWLDTHDELEALALRPSRKKVRKWRGWAKGPRL